MSNKDVLRAYYITYILNTFIPSTHITPYKHITAKQCYNCYVLESHPTRLCPQPCPSCSICSDFHHYKNCPKAASQNKLDFYCRNCDTHGHKAIDRSCPAYKRVVDRKRLGLASSNNERPHRQPLLPLPLPYPTMTTAPPGQGDGPPHIQP